MASVENTLLSAFQKLPGRERIKVILDAQSRTQASVARSIKCAPETLSRVFSGEQSPRADRIRGEVAKLLKISRVELDKLIDG